MGLKENQYYDRDSISYPVVYRQKKNNINTKKTNEVTEQIRNRNSKAHKRNILRQNDRLKKYTNYIEDDDEIIQLNHDEKKPGKTSPTGIETSSIDLLYNEKNISNLTPKKLNTPMKKKNPTTKYITPVKTEINGKYITPSKLPRQTTPGNEETPIKSPFSETLPDGILISSPVCITPLKTPIPINASSSSLSSINNGVSNYNLTSSISSLSISNTTILNSSLSSSNLTTPSQKRLHALSPPPTITTATTTTITSPLQSTPQLAPDVVSRAIFHALFGSLNKSMSSSLPWDDDDDDEDGEDAVGDDLYQCKSVEPVDELWFTRLMSTSLLTTQALNYALHTTGTTTATSFFQQQVNRGNPILTQDDLLSNYINPSFITSLISQLPYEDERFTSPRLSVLKAIYKTVPKFRSLIAYSLLSVSNQRFMRCKTSSKLAVMYELDINHTGTKIGDMYSYSIPEHVDVNSAYSCFPVDDIPYPPNQKSKIPNQPPQLLGQTSSMSTSSATTNSTPTITVRDHDQSIIELALYMIITTEEEDEEEEGEREERGGENQNIDEDDNNEQNKQLQVEKNNQNLFNSKPSLSRLFLSTVINVLRCYGRRLGKTTEGVEQPNILKSCLRAFEEMIARVKDDSVEKIIIPAILHSWPGGGNSIREAAFLKALGVILPHCRPYFIVNPFITNNSTSLTKSLSLSLPPSSALYKTLSRVILCINSIHFKVCQESMNLILNEKILSHYLYDSEECRHLLDSLVNALRQNRHHWNISVKQTSERCLDQIFELME